MSPHLAQLTQGPVVLCWSQPINSILEMPGGTHLGPYYLRQAPTDISLTVSKVWLAQPCGSYYKCNPPFSSNDQRTLKIQGLLLPSPRGYTTC